MRGREETFILSPTQVFQQEIVDTRMDYLIQRMSLLEEKVNEIAKLLAEISKKLESSKTE
jgi:hypothetical protein